MSTNKNEMAHERAARLALEIGARSSKSMATGEVKSLMESIASLGQREVGAAQIEDTCRAPVKLDALRRGDVFIAKVTGGKARPWVVLAVCGENVSAVTMSSANSAPNLEPSRCRFWPHSWIGTTVSLFEIEYAGREVTRPYTNLPHLREIEHSISRGFTPTKSAPVSSLSDIRNSIFAKQPEPAQ